MEQAECMQKGNNTTKHGVSSGSPLFAKISTLLIMVDYFKKKVYEFNYRYSTKKYMNLITDTS